MDIACPACAARYIADEQKLRGKTARMRCKACNTVWLVSGPADGMNESKRAAVVKRGADREHADLFASRPADLGSVKQTLRPPPPDSMLAGVAARNENSVLFTVDALQGAARVKTPEPEPAPMSSAFMMADDEGVIDLNALASTPPKVGARSVAPLFTSEPPPAAFAADVSNPGESPMMTAGGMTFGKRAIAGFAAAAVALVLCSFGLAAAFKGEEPVARTNMMMAPVAAAAPPAAAAIAAVTPATPAAASDDDAKSPSVGVGKKGKATGKVKNSSGSGSKASLSKVQSSGVAPAAQSKAPATPKAADKCGCKGEFNCILRCTAKGA